MSFADLIKKGSLRQFATATVATVATVRPQTHSSVASVATVNVATAQKQAANDPASAEPHGLENLQKPAMPVAANDPAPEPPTDPNAWRELAAAYHAHHFHCSTCIAAGCGAGYGLRCGVGAALWTSYQNT